MRRASASSVGPDAVVAPSRTALGTLRAPASTIGPNWMASGDPNGQGIGTRAATRFTGSDYTGKAKTPEQYLFESIVSPDAYIVPGNAAYVGPDGKSIMPHTFATQMSAEMMANVLAYLETIK